MSDVKLELPHDEELNRLLQESAREAFDTMMAGFMGSVVRSDTPSGECAPAPALPAVKVDREVVVDFNGPSNGYFSLRCNAEGAMDIARGLLMMDDCEALKVEEVADALGECANVVAGLLKNKALSPCGDFKMGIPRHCVPYETRDQSGSSLLCHLKNGVVSMEVWLQR